MSRENCVLLVCDFPRTLNWPISNVFQKCHDTMVFGSVHWVMEAAKHGERNILWFMNKYYSKWEGIINRLHNMSILKQKD